MTEYERKLASQRQHVLDYVKRCVEESRLGEKRERRLINQTNWDYYHGRIDWSHKSEDDPVVHLHKVGVAAERMRSKFKQALMRYDQWLDLEHENPSDEIAAPLPAFAAKNLLMKQFNYAKAKVKISDAILRGGMESRMTLKVGGCHVTKPRFVNKAGKLVREEDKVWQLELTPIPFEFLHLDAESPDAPLFVIEEAKVDRFRVLALSSDDPSPDKPFRKSAVESLSDASYVEAERTEDHAKGKLPTPYAVKERHPVRLHNFFGTILSEDGSIYEWELSDGSKVPLENIFCVIGNEMEVLVDPQRNTRSSGKSPYVYADPIRSPGPGRKALFDAGTAANKAEDELFSLMLAGAIKSVHNINWYRKDWISDKRVLSGGLKDGDSIGIDAAPPGATPMGVMQTGQVPQEAFMMKNILDSVFAENVISNQLDLSGNLPGKQVRSTEVVTANTAISDVFDSMASDLEDIFISQLAIECLYEIVQHLDEIDPDEVKTCFLGYQDKAEAFLKMSAKQRFDAINGMYCIYGKGLHGLIANQAKGQALINLVSTIMANPLTASAVESDISVSKLIRLIAKGMNIDIEEIEPDAAERQMIQAKQLIREQAVAQASAMQGMGQQAQANPGNPSQGSLPSINQPGPIQGMQ